MVMTKTNTNPRMLTKIITDKDEKGVDTRGEGDEDSNS